MSDRNKHGLGRTPPSDVRRQVRQRCGFGCVICGLAFYDYEHFAPDFADALIHDPKGMTLLCSQCNQKRARGRLSAETVAHANQNPRGKQQGYANEMFDFGVGQPIEVIVASATFVECPVLIEINGYSILSISDPREPGSPFLLSGLFADDTGDITLKIVDNEFSVGADNWDVDCQGSTIKIKQAHRDISLILRMEPPRRLIVEKIDMEFDGVRLVGDSRGMKMSLDAGRSWSTFQAMSMTNCRVGMALQNRLIR